MDRVFHGDNSDISGVFDGFSWEKERLTRSVRRVAGRYGPVARATHGDKRAIRPGWRGCFRPGRDFGQSDTRTQ